MGKTVFFFVPNPNSLKEPSSLYKKAGETNWIIANIITNNKIEKEVKLFLIMDLFIIK